LPNRFTPRIPNRRALKTPELIAARQLCPEKKKRPARLRAETKQSKTRTQANVKHVFVFSARTDTTSRTRNVFGTATPKGKYLVWGVRKYNTQGMNTKEREEGRKRKRSKLGWWKETIKRPTVGRGTQKQEDDDEAKSTRSDESWFVPRTKKKR